MFLLEYARLPVSDTSIILSIMLLEVANGYLLSYFYFFFKSQSLDFIAYSFMFTGLFVIHL